jgi:hypothetical protein
VNELAPREDRSPIPGWELDSSGLVAKTRWHYSWAIFYVVAMIWNLVLPQLEIAKHKGSVDVFGVIGRIAAVAFALLAVRALVARTIIRFTAREMVVENRLEPWARYRVDLAEIKAFQVAEHATKKYASVGVELVSGAVVTLPIDWQPLDIVRTGSPARLWVAPVGDASWLASALTEMLANARLLGHDTYRS